MITIEEMAEHAGEALAKAEPAARRGYARASAEIHTLVECAAPDCKRGVRVRDSVGGMCVECAEDELERRWKLLARAHEVLEAYAPNHPIVDAIADALEAK